jgi:hypothetical protein
MAKKLAKQLQNCLRLASLGRRVRSGLKRDGGEEAPPFLFTVRNSEMVFSLVPGLTSAAMLTNPSKAE